ncbi:hypothetical protein ACI65C_011463 [Semiaphis heraclei]
MLQQPQQFGFGFQHPPQMMMPAQLQQQPLQYAMQPLLCILQPLPLQHQPLPLQATITNNSKAPKAETEKNGPSLQNTVLSLNQGNTLEEINISLMNMPEDYSLGHCVAKDMRMSAGIAMYFKSIYKRVGELMDKRQNVGSVAYLRENNRFIYYLITKELSKQKPTYSSLTAAITKLRDLIVEHGVKKLALPRGCGLDKLDWLTVRGIIEDLFQNVGCSIKICHFTNNMSLESQMLKIQHPTVVRRYENIKNIWRGEFEKLNVLLYSRKTSTTPMYWDENFQSVDNKYCFKS